MRVFILIGSLCAALMILVGCSNDVQTWGCTTDEPCKDDRVCCQGICADPEACADECTDPLVGADESLPNGFPADVFYGRFVRGEAEEVALGHGAFPGQDSSAFHAHLFLYECGGATVLYEEGFLGHGFQSNDGFDSRGPSHKTRIDTSWTIDGTQLVIGEVFDCLGQMISEHYLLDCTLKKSVGSNEAVGGVASLYHEYRIPSPDDEEFADFQ